MQTFAKARPFVAHPAFERDRERALAQLDLDDVDAPLRGLIARLALLPFCFTLQSCWGHFVHAGQPDADNLERLPDRDPGEIRYRLAYLALCIQDVPDGHRLRRRLEESCELDPAYIQFGSPTWFQRQCPNVYALQIEPERHALQDVATLPHAEALHVESLRDRVFLRLVEELGED